MAYRCQSTIVSSLSRRFWYLNETISSQNLVAHECLLEVLGHILNDSRRAYWKIWYRTCPSISLCCSRRWSNAYIKKHLEDAESVYFRLYHSLRTDHVFIMFLYYSIWRRRLAVEPGGYIQWSDHNIGNITVVTPNMELKSTATDRIAAQMKSGLNHRYETSVTVSVH